jgi:hypothetical protein
LKPAYRQALMPAAHDAAQRAIEEQAILRLSAEDQQRFAPFAWIRGFSHKLAEIQSQTSGGVWDELEQLPLGASREFNSPGQGLARQRLEVG